MSMTFEELGRTEPRRDRYGRPLIVPLDGGKPRAYTRPTTIADTLDDRHNLELWMQRQVILGLVDRPDLVAKAATTDANDKAALNKVASEARDAAGSSAAATMGTAIHAAVETVNRGGDAPAMFAEQIAAYRAALDTFGATVDTDHVEQFCVNEPVGAAGTFDMRINIGGTWYIADLKTGSSVDYSGRSFAVQLAIYAGATSYYDVATDTHSAPAPVDQERAVIVHLPAHGTDCTLHWLDIAAGREALKHALWTRAWRRRNDLLTNVVAAVPDNTDVIKKPVARKKAERPARTRGNATPKIAPVADGSDIPEWRREGDLVDMTLVEEVRARSLQIDTDLLHLWVKEASDAGVPFGMGGGSHTERRYRIACAALAICEQDVNPDYARAVLACVHGDDAHKPTNTIGSLLGHLSADQATAVDRIARTGVTVIDDDGRLHIKDPG